MKLLRWLKANVNLISFVVGVSLVALGQKELGQLVLQQGATL